MIKLYISKERVSILGKLDPMPEHRTKFAFKGKRENIAKENKENLVYLNQHIDN